MDCLEKEEEKKKKHIWLIGQVQFGIQLKQKSKKGLVLYIS